MAAEKINTIPKIIATTCVDTYTAIKAPATAPRVVATSRNIPIRIFVIPSFMYAAAAPDELAIESQFYGKNIQSMLKLGRAQGVAIAAALQRNIPIFEYAPKKIKMSITGTGEASKEQIALLLSKFMTIPTTISTLDETDAIAIAYCHHLQGNLPTTGNPKCKDWGDFIKQNPDKVL